MQSRIRKRRLTHAAAVPVNRIFSPSTVKAILSESVEFRHFETKLKSHGFRLHLCFFEPGEELSLCEDLVRSPRTCDGVLILSGGASEGLAALFQKHRMANVAFDYAAEQYHLNTVRVQTAEGLRQAVAHLHDLWHRRIGFVGPRYSYRYPLTVAALAALQLPLDESLNCWSICARQTETRPYRRKDRGTGNTAQVDPAWLGTRESCLSASLHVDVHTGWYPRAVSLVQRSTARFGFTRE